MASCTLPVRLDSSSQNFSLVLSNSDMWRNDTTFVDMIITWERCYFSTIIRLLAIFLFSLIHVRTHTHTHKRVYTPSKHSFWSLTDLYFIASKFLFSKCLCLSLLFWISHQFCLSNLFLLLIKFPKYFISCSSCDSKVLCKRNFQVELVQKSVEEFAV